MADLNIFILIGRLTKDPETSYARSGDPICKFSIANNHSYKKDDPASFFNITSFKKTAEIIQQWCKKGDLIRVTCRVTQNNYTDKEGVKHYGYNFNCVEMQFLSTKGGAVGGDQGQTRPAGNPYTNDPKAKNQPVQHPAHPRQDDPTSFDPNDFEPLSDDEIPL